MSALTQEKVYQQFVWFENGKIVVATETGEFRLTPAESKDLCYQLLNWERSNGKNATH